MYMLTRIAVTIAMLAALALPGPVAGRKRPMMIALQPYLGVVWSFEAELGGKRRTFLFDTGGGITVITPQVAAEIGCTPWGQITGFRMRGDRIDMTRCDGVAMRSDAATLTAPTVGVLDFARLLPSGAPPVAGSIALDSFAGRIVTIDLANRRLILETPASLKRRIARATQIEIRLAREASGHAVMPLVAVHTPKGKLWMELDSGSDASIIVGGGNAALFGMSADAKTPQRFRGRLVGDVPLTADDARATPLIYDGNIGDKVLRHWVVTIDLRHGRAWIARDRQPG